MRFFLRFYEELNDFLPTAKKYQLIEFQCFQTTTCKDAIESLGVPHTEVDLVLVNGQSESFDHLLKDSDRVSVYPMFESFDISSLTKVRATPIRKTKEATTKFVVDVNLGKLAHFLRMLGFDTIYDRHLEDDEALAHIFKSQCRILLTRYIGLLKRKDVDHGYFVRSRAPKEQALEVLRRFDLVSMIQLCSRCLQCNCEIVPIAKDKVLGLVPSLVEKAYMQFWFCPNCEKIYWEGTHFEHMKKSVKEWKRHIANEKQ